MLFMQIMHCPKCHHEYRLGFINCPECKIGLKSGDAPQHNSEFDPGRAQAALASVQVAAFTTLPMNEAIRLRDNLLSQEILAGLAPAEGGCDPSGCSTNFTVMVPADQLQTLNQRYQAAFESYAAEQGMTLRNEPENTCLCCGSGVASDDVECSECGIALI
jgi:hypothetical protein